MLKLQHLTQQLLITPHKGKALVTQAALHQRLAYKHAVRLLGIHPGVVHLAAVVHQQAIKRGALVAHHRAAFGVVMRLQHLFVQNMTRHTLDPRGLDLRHPPGVQPAGIHQLSGHHPALGPFAQMHPRMRQKLDLSGAGKSVVLFALVAHITQQARQQRQMQLFVGGGLGV